MGDDGYSTAAGRLLVVCCSEISDPNWSWLEPALGEIYAFRFVRCVPQNFLEKAFRPLNLSRIRGCFEAVRLAKTSGADVLVAHGPTLAAWCGIFRFIFFLRTTTLLAHSFNFTDLPNRTKRIIFSFALRSVDHFIVYSRVERILYSQAFRLPLDRFEFVHWGVQPPAVVGPAPPDKDCYVCAIGGNARDYGTLISAAQQLPHIPFVLVVRPSSLANTPTPPNITVHVDLPLDATINILYYSRFMVLPLVNSTVPCGHVTLVAAMHLGKAMVVTASQGVSDYANDGQNSLLVPPADIGCLTQAIHDLWSNRTKCEKLGENGRNFAARECTEERTVSQFRRWLSGRKVSTVPGPAELRS